MITVAHVCSDHTVGTHLGWQLVHMADWEAGTTAIPLELRSREIKFIPQGYSANIMALQLRSV